MPLYFMSPRNAAHLVEAARSSFARAKLLRDIGVALDVVTAQELTDGDFDDDELEMNQQVLMQQLLEEAST